MQGTGEGNFKWDSQSQPHGEGDKVRLEGGEGMRHARIGKEYATPPGKANPKAQRQNIFSISEE